MFVFFLFPWGFLLPLSDLSRSLLWNFFWCFFFGAEHSGFHPLFENSFRIFTLQKFTFSEIVWLCGWLRALPDAKPHCLVILNQAGSFIAEFKTCINRAWCISYSVAHANQVALCCQMWNADLWRKWNIAPTLLAASLSRVRFYARFATTIFLSVGSGVQAKNFPSCYRCDHKINQRQGIARNSSAYPPSCAFGYV